MEKLATIKRWSTSYLTEEGFEATISFEGEDLDEVVKEGHALLRRLRGKVQPVRSRPILPRGRPWTPPSR